MRRRISRPVVGTVALIAVLFLVLRNEWSAPLESGALRALAPVVHGVSAVTSAITGTARSVVSVGTLSRSVRILEGENATLKALVARLESIEAENARLREELKLLPRATYRLVTADVISRSTDGVSEALIVNRGARDGLGEGFPVIAHDGIVVGRVQNVDMFTATIVLLTDSSLRVAAETLGGGAEGLVHGARGLEVVMDTIPRTDSITVGDRVVTTGTDGTFPPHLLVGTIRDVVAPGNEIFQSAKIELIVDLRRLRVVSIILP